MADFRLGRLKFKWRGDWAASTAYVIDDIVKYGANSYVCVVNHTSASSETSFYSEDINNNRWELHTEGLRQRGDWTPSTWYAINDLVKYGNSIYRCITAYTSGLQFQFNFWSAYSEGLVFEDTWDSSTLYQKGDIVGYGGYTYIAEQNSTNVAPNTDTAYWKVLTTGYLSQGAYNPAEVYEPGNTVRYGGNTYACKVTTNTETLAIGSITGDGTTVTVTFQQAQAAAPYGIGDQITIAGVDIGGYNGTFRVGTVSTTQVTFAHTEQTAGATGGNVSYVPVPTNIRFWDLVVEGFNWGGQWSASAVYQLGDVINRNGNSYICITSNTTGAATAPELDSNGNYWNYLSQGGDAAQVLQEIGDLIYQAAGGINRIALPLGDQSAAALREADGQVLAVGGSPLLPRWEKNNSTAPVYYVAKEGSDTYNGRSISRAFGSLRYACDYIAGLTGANAPSASNPHTIYVKAGVYEETLPITIPQFVSIIGDNLRTSVIKPASGSSNLQALTLSGSLSHVLFGDTISNHDGTKTAKVLDSDYNNNVHILNLTGGEWDTGDKYVDIVSHLSGDAHDLLLANKAFIAEDAYYQHVNNDGAVPGVEADVKAKLVSFVEELAYNVKAGANNKVYDFAADVLANSNLTGNSGADIILLDYVAPVAQDVIRNVLVSVAAGNNLTQTRDTTITVDAASPYCATQTAAVTTLVGVATSAFSNGNLNATARSTPYLDISAAGTRTNEESTMFYVGSHTTVKDLIFEGMSGFVPSTSNDEDLDTSTIKGVYFRLDPNSPVQKSPYIQNCTAIGGAAIGIMIDGSVHQHFDNTSTPSYKSMVFDAYTQILDGGVGFYVTRGASSEIVSCFTYYAHISYSSTRGGKIRAVSGNSSYGKYGVISRGFDATESTIDGNVKGLRLELDPASPKNGSFTAGERIEGGTSGAIGELISDQSASNYLYFFPVTGTFVQGEVVTGQTSSSYVTLVNNTDAVTGQKGFLLTVEGLSAAPDQGGSVEMQDNGINDDAGSYVIANSSYTAADGRGTLTVERARLGSTAASHTGTTLCDLYAFVDPVPTTGNPTTLNSSIDGTTTTLFVNQVTGMVGNGFLIVGTEMMQVVSFQGANEITVTRGVEGTVATSHASNSNVTVLAQKVVGQDEIIEDFDSAATDIRVAAANIIFKEQDYIKVDNEFFRLTGISPDATGITTLLFSDEKVIPAGNPQNFKIRYRYSQVRLTAHDFLDVGTGSKANTNWPFLPLSPNVPSYETLEDRPGRVYYVSTDQDGNFAVGKYFRVEQATGKATLDASAFDLSGLSSLRLGSIGAQLGAAINEFSTDPLLSQNSDEKVPTQRAVKTYVDALTGVVGDFSVAGNLSVAGTTTTVSSVTVDVKDRNITLGKVAAAAFNGDLTAGQNTITNVSDTENLAPGVVVSITSGGGSTTLGGNVTVVSISGTTVTLSEAAGGGGSATGVVLAAGGPTDVTADTGGLTILGATNKEFSWLSGTNSGSFTSTENLTLNTGKAFYIDSTEVLTESAVLGKTIAADNTLGGTISSDSKLPTQLSVKTYVDSKTDKVTATAYFVASM
jgi:hypothetical protein